MNMKKKKTFALCVWLIFHAFRGIAHAPDPAPLEGADGPWIDWRDVRTGDLIVCRGTSIGSRPVRQFSLTPWTHVGIAVQRDDELFIYHADPENGCLDRITGVRNRTGAQPAA
jgi:hypothetical protein